MPLLGNYQQLGTPPKKGLKYYIAFNLLKSLGIYLQGECEESTGTNSSKKASWLDTLLNTYMNKS